tara:strand:+ start:1543 stop:1968 length:426 start_codon:yes stop_codon:yes gene_type:complete
MTENIGYNESTFGLLLFCLILLPIAAAFLAPLVGGMIVLWITVWQSSLELIDHLKKPKIVTKSVYVDRPVTVYKTIKEKITEPQKEKNTKPKVPDFIEETIGGLHSLGLKKSQAKKIVAKVYDANIHSNTESLLKDCLSHL